MKYTVVRRMDVEGKLYFPGDVVDDPDRATLLIERGFIVPLAKDVSPSPDVGKTELTINELRSRARELGLPASGTKVELAAAIDAEEARLTSEQASSASPSVEGPAHPTSGEQVDEGGEGK